MKALISKMWPLGIRLQLMLWYTIIFAALLLFSGALFYLHVEHSLEANLDTTLQVRAQAVAEGITLVGGTIVVRDVTGDLPGFDVSPSDQNVTCRAEPGRARSRSVTASKCGSSAWR